MVQTAFQCPYKGGNAVYRARVLLENITDTLGYDDAATCSQVGIYRAIKSIEQNATKSLKIRPNPALNEIEIIIDSGLKENCSIEITDVLGRVCFIKNLKCNVISQKLNFNLEAGFYSVKIKSENKIIGNAKLLIIK